MEIRGDEFIKNLELEKEKVKLKEQTDSLNAQKQKTIFQSSDDDIDDIKIDENITEPIFQELDDIVLNNNENNKQKYIVFGFALILLFLITIITIRLIQEPKTQNNFTSDDIIEDLDKKVLQKTTKKINKSLDIDKIIQSEDPIKVKQQDSILDKNKKNSTSDIFGIEKKKTPTKPIEVTQLEKPKTEIKKNIIKKSKPIINKPIQEINLNKLFDKKKIVKNDKPKGYYIQVGAFTKAPDKKLINALKKAKYNFLLHKMKIKGRVYTKVLVGSYKNKKSAQKDLDQVRKTIHNSKSYILRFK